MSYHSNIQNTKKIWPVGLPDSPDLVHKAFADKTRLDNFRARHSVPDLSNNELVKHELQKLKNAAKLSRSIVPPKFLKYFSMLPILGPLDNIELALTSGDAGIAPLSNTEKADVNYAAYRSGYAGPFLYGDPDSGPQVMSGYLSGGPSAPSVRDPSIWDFITGQDEVHPWTRDINEAKHLAAFKRRQT